MQRHPFARLGGMTLAVLALLPIRPAAAQESPAEITGEEWACQIAFGRSVTALGLATADCLAECRSGPSFNCSVGFSDAATRDCLDRALAKAEARTLDACAGSACPECYGPSSFDGCRNHARNVFGEARSFTNSALGLLYCNDSGSADGLTRPEARCRSRLVASAGRFTEVAARCFAGCNRAARRGRVEASACDAALLDRPGLHPKTQACVDKARDRLLEQCEDACVDPPDCFGLTCGDVLLGANLQLSDLEPEVFCEDVPPPVCGDGAVNGFERCDQSATPNGCGPGETCSTGCYSCYGVCGDGIKSPSEQCDASAGPEGCSPGFGCNSGCFCQPLCGNGRIDPGEACEPFGAQTCAGGDVCSEFCTCETLTSVDEDLSPCSTVDVWEFEAAADQTVIVRADTLDTETAADLVLSGRCSDGSSFSALFDFFCAFGSRFCPETSFRVGAGGTCRVTVSSYGGSACTDPSTARYRLEVSGTGPTLVADDSAGGAFL